MIPHRFRSRSQCGCSFIVLAWVASFGMVFSPGLFVFKMLSFFPFVRLLAFGSMRASLPFYPSLLFPLVTVASLPPFRSLLTLRLSQELADSIGFPEPPARSIFPYFRSHLSRLLLLLAKDSLGESPRPSLSAI